MDNVEWRDIPSLVGLYKASNLGEIWSVRKRKKICLWPDRVGYLRFNISRNCKIRKMFVHRAIMEAFVGPCPEGFQVNHRDGEKSNNRIDNLEYVTPLQNMTHASKTGLRPPSMMGENNYTAKLTNEEVLRIRELKRMGSKTKALAKMFNVSIGTISSIVANRKWRHL